MREFKRDDEEKEIDQDTYDMCMDKLREVYKVITIMDCESQFIELSNGFPALALYVESKYDINDPALVLVAFMPVDIRGESHLFAQFNVSVLEELPEDRWKEVEEFIGYYNTSYMIGHFSLINDTLMGMYSIYMDKEAKIDQLLFAKTISIMAVESEDLREFLSHIISGELTAKELIQRILNVDAESFIEKIENED